jgi:hypothetical protein
MVTKKLLMYIHVGVYIKCMVFVWFTKKLEFSRQILDKHCITTLYENPSSWNQIVSWGRTLRIWYSLFTTFQKLLEREHRLYVHFFHTYFGFRHNKKIRWRWPWILSLQYPDWSLSVFSASRTWAHFLPNSSSTCELLLLSEIIIIQPYHVSSLLLSAFPNPLPQVHILHNTFDVLLCIWHINL